MRYRTKKEILEHLGKDGKDVRYLDRAVASGEIIMRDRMYIVSKEYIEELEEKMSVKQDIDIDIRPIVVKSINQESTVDKNINLSDLEKKIESLNSDLEFQIAENEKLEKKVATFQECIRRCYLRAQNVKKDKTPWPVFKKEVLKLEENISGEDNQ